MNHLTVVSVLCLATSAAYAKIPPAAPTTNSSTSWASPPQQPEKQIKVHTRHSRRLFYKKAPASPISSVALLQADIAALRRELAAVRVEVGHPPEPKPAYDPVFTRLGLWGAAETIKPLASLTRLPDLRLPSQLPADPETQPVPFSSRLQGIEAVDEVQIARLYLAKTATIGFTMARQGVEVAIGRLHPDFVVRLAAAIKRAREAGLGHVGVFSAYRPPAFGVGGFSDKFNSLHSYGLAADMTGIGGPGSKSARLWQKIVAIAGLFLPYGPNNRAEFNHTQLISNKMAAIKLRGTITSTAPKDLTKMWLASGVAAHVAEPVAEIRSADKLPTVDWGQ